MIDYFDYAAVWAEGLASDTGLAIPFSTLADARRYMAALHRSKRALRKLIVDGELAPCDACVTRLLDEPGTLISVWVGVPKPSDYGIVEGYQ